MKAGFASGLFASLASPSVGFNPDILAVAEKQNAIFNKGESATGTFTLVFTQADFDQCTVLPAKSVPFIGSDGKPASFNRQDVSIGFKVGAKNHTATLPGDIVLAAADNGGTVAVQLQKDVSEKVPGKPRTYYNYKLAAAKLDDTKTEPQKNQNQSDTVIP